MSDYQTPSFKVGDGATIGGWSDRHPATVIAVNASGKTVTVQRDDFRRTDSNGMSECQEYEFTPNPNGSVLVFTLRKNGRYILKGDSIQSATRLGAGRSAYYNFSL